MQPPSPLQLASCRVPAPIRADVCDGHWHEYARRQCTGLILLVQIDKTSRNNIETTKYKELSLQMQVIGQGKSSIELYVRSGLFMGCTSIVPSRNLNPKRPSCNPGSSSGPMQPALMYAGTSCNPTTTLAIALYPRPTLLESLTLRLYNIYCCKRNPDHLARMYPQKILQP